MPSATITTSGANNAADQKMDGAGFAVADSLVTMQNQSSSANAEAGGIRFPDGLPCPAGSTIVSATFESWCTSSALDEPECNIHFEAIDDSPDFATDADVVGRDRSAESVSWDAVVANGAYDASPDIAAVVQEHIDREGYEADTPFTVLLIPFVSGLSADFHQIQGPTNTNPPRLQLEWTEPAPPAGGLSGTAPLWLQLATPNANRSLIVGWILADVRGVTRTPNYAPVENTLQRILGELTGSALPQPGPSAELTLARILATQTGGPARPASFTFLCRMIATVSD